MNMDLEMEAWRTDWQVQYSSDAVMMRLDLRGLVDRERRKMALGLCGQLLAGVILLAFSAWFASNHPTLEWILWAAVIWIGTFLAATFAIWNKSGTWKALSQSNAAFLDLSRERCLRELRALRLGRWFLAVQLAIAAGWLSFDFAVRHLPMRPYFFGGGVTIVMAAAYLEWFAMRERRSLRALGRLDEFKD